MRLLKVNCLLVILTVTSVCACKRKTEKKVVTPSLIIYKGLYSLGPEAKIFKDCSSGKEYWVTDSTAQLELKYWQVIPAEKPNEPVYIEAEGNVIPSDLNDNGHEDGMANTLVVTKLITITKDIPEKGCKLK